MVIHVSQDTHACNGQKLSTCWDDVSTCFASNTCMWVVVTCQLKDQRTNGAKFKCVEIYWGLCTSSYDEIIEKIARSTIQKSLDLYIT